MHNVWERTWVVQDKVPWLGLGSLKAEPEIKTFVQVVSGRQSHEEEVREQEDKKVEGKAKGHMSYWHCDCQE